MEYSNYYNLNMNIATADLRGVVCVSPTEDANQFSFSRSIFNP